MPQLGDKQVLVLRALYPDKLLIQARIAEAIDVHRSNLGKSLTYLEQELYIERVEDGQYPQYRLLKMGRVYFEEHGLDPIATSSEHSSARAKKQRASAGRRSARSRGSSSKASSSTGGSTVQTQESPSAKRESLDPSLYRDDRHLDTAVQTASELNTRELFMKRLAGELKLNPKDDAETIIAHCRKTDRQKVVRAVGVALKELAPEPKVMRQWMTKHLPSLLGARELESVVRKTQEGRSALELKVKVDCFGFIECLLALVGERNAGLRLVERPNSHRPDRPFIRFDSEHRVEISTYDLTGISVADRAFDAQAQQVLFKGYWKQHGFGQISDSQIPEDFIREELEERSAPIHVVFGASKEQLAKDFQAALLRRQIAVDIVLTEEASKATAELREWLNKYFCWPLQNERLNDK